MLQLIWPSIRRAVLLLPILAGTASVVPATSCGSSTGPDTGSGPHCKKGCPCGKACIDCSYTCHKGASYALTGIVPDSLRPR